MAFLYIKDLYMSWTRDLTGYSTKPNDFVIVNIFLGFAFLKEYNVLVVCIKCTVQCMYKFQSYRAVTARERLIIKKCSDICTSNWWQLWWQLFSLFLLAKNNEREKWRENKNVMWIWERKLSKSYHIMVVQILFL